MELGDGVISLPFQERENGLFLLPCYIQIDLRKPETSHSLAVARKSDEVEVRKYELILPKIKSSIKKNVKKKKDKDFLPIGTLPIESFPISFSFLFFPAGSNYTILFSPAYSIPKLNWEESNRN